MVDDVGDPPPVRVVWGTGTAPTAVASYDAALAGANVHDYNLATISSIVPPHATVEAVGTAGDLGPAGGRLWVLESRATAGNGRRASAALGWATGEGAGLLYEAAGELTEEAARDEAAAGLDAGRAIRDRDLATGGLRSVSVEAPRDAYGTAVVLAVFGESEPML